MRAIGGDGRLIPTGRRDASTRRRDLLGPAAGVDQSAFEEIGQLAVWPRRLGPGDLFDEAAVRLRLDPTHGVEPSRGTCD
jgi:hypothetical protein